MSYLAMSAATIDNNNHNTNNETPINKKRQHHNSTQKYRPQINTQKVNSILQSIHNNTIDEDDLGNYHYSTAHHSDNFKPMNSFDFPDKPISAGSERTKMEKMEGMNKMEKMEGMEGMSNYDAPQPIDNDHLKLQELQSSFMNDAQVRDYYRKLLPGYKEPSSDKPQYSHSSKSSSDHQVLIDKLNYMIHLLEEEQDQKTENVTEEVVLYSFLGIFIIFIVDSFAKSAKYIR
jgi:hypothetical protein